MLCPGDVLCHLPSRLKDQYCFRTKAAVATLSLVEVERHDL